MPCTVYSTVQSIGVGIRTMQTVVDAVLARTSSKERTVGIHCVGLRRMRTLNRTFRGIDRPTDVLSFPIEKIYNSQELGDIFICPSYIQAQARRFTVPYREEYLRMLIHGVLHVCGYDHETPAHAKRMFRLQEEILSLHR